MASPFLQLSPSLFVHPGCCNVGVLRHGSCALLIDCGNGEVAAALEGLAITQVDRILFTHHHRDSAAGVVDLAQPATQIGVPAGERRWFAEVERFWSDPQMRWHLYNVHPHNLMLAESIRVDETYQGGDCWRWGEATITVLDTPGHTDGSVSYLVEVDGGRFVFSGDTIYGAGQLWELYSLQKGETTTDYHGFLGDRRRLLASLEKILAVAPTLLIPTHGQIIDQPQQAVSALRARLDHCYDRYVAISALRYYFPDLFRAFEGRPGHLPVGAGQPVPDFLHHFGTTWVVIAANKEALVMDCGSTAYVEALRQLQEQGEITTVTACWVTHYHDDHVDALPEFQADFPCPTYAHPVVAAVIEQPRAWRLPCISPATVRVDKRPLEGESWMWNEFCLTAYHFPGQTYYHAGLLVEGRGLRLFFSGDSFTPAGIDDYCAGNRHLLGAGVGYDRCLALIDELQPTHIFNCHVGPAFRFTSAEIGWMRANLAERERLYGELFPWDHANYGLDEHWVRCDPYEQDVVAGQTVQLRVVITNHSAVAKSACCRPILPRSWGQTVAEQPITLAPKAEGVISFAIAIPAQVNTCADDMTMVDSPASAAKPAPKRFVIPLELCFDARPLGQFREALFVLQPSPITG
ncbi:MAG TPA: MBL fold metallo-hydrolase [Caldilineaceae bacterium]|nr:MBL fold metallo-hydrolase [Caldilineaceae bacterium]